MNTLPEFHESEGGMSHPPRPMVIDNEGRRETSHAHAAFDILTRAYANDHEDIYVPMGGSVMSPQY